MYTAKHKVYWFAIASRSLILLLQMVFNLLCPDHNADAFRTPIDSTEKQYFFDRLVKFFFEGLTRWDAQYFIHIAKYGYTYENTLAFFPLYPWLVRFVAGLAPPTLNQSSTIILAGIVINFVCFVKLALILYDLTDNVFQNTKVAYRSAILFCINPASVFFSALYTETLFAFLTFYCMLESVNNNPCVFLPLSLSTLVRSNGLVNTGFPAYTWLRSLLVTSIPNYVTEYRLYHSNKRSVLFDFRHIFLSIFQIFTTIFVSLLPFLGLQIHYYALYCKTEANATFPYHVQKYALDNDLLMPGRHEFAWCNNKMPIAYSYVQSKYWNVGFLKYYEFKQIPNFCLALPALYLMLRCILGFFIEHKSKFFTLEFYTGIAKKRKSNERYPLAMFVFVVHAAFLTLFCILFVHIQVSTRLLCSATPLLYWYCALLTLEKDEASKGIKEPEFESTENMFSKWKVFFITQQSYTKSEKFVYRYFLGYTVLGCLMFANFYPWT
ncbi:GPI mannosyltransferase 2 [Copidosoma floridanum]|uniref:GPI mannosyltransferase 2 n=1 Tax=Copidosoma floridanum TaxID=29053 RepID=UPI0006C9AB1B|nr:GPI mannosyltransferase 2 [Copidosoma floridanum]XP_014218439.1 GPI mannosyltransferase 2 [Copidosoma floridanum]